VRASFSITVILRDTKSMTYSVKQLARLSGVTVRTLHFYDEIGLLKPAFLGANGYRFYQEKQLLTLQQILFFRELGLELKEIQRLLGRSRFDHAKALRSHRKTLLADMDRKRELIETIDNTLKQIEGKRKMKAAELFKGFDEKTQARHEEELIKRFGESAREDIAQSRRKVSTWSKADWEKSAVEWDALCRALLDVMRCDMKLDAPEVQQLVRRHFEWLKQFWTPNREAYAGHGKFLADSELRQAYDKYDPKLADYLGEAIRIFAAKQLT
jgi:DNA-binding transcriptional MerR regulator